MQVLMYKASQQKYLTGGFTLSNILLIGLIAVSILLVFLAIAILIRLSRLSNKLKQMGINYDVTGFGVKQKEENPFKNMHNNYDGDTAIINNSNNRTDYNRNGSLAYNYRVPSGWHQERIANGEMKLLRGYDYDTQDSVHFLITDYNKYYSKIISISQYPIYFGISGFKLLRQMQHKAHRHSRHRILSEHLHRHRQYFL